LLTHAVFIGVCCHECVGRPQLYVCFQFGNVQGAC
jgi:hypothetical protein